MTIASPNTLVMGRHIIDEDDIELSLEAGAGLRQSKDSITGETTNSGVAKIAGDFEWDINDYVEFTQGLEISTASDATITLSETALKSHVSDQLYVKLGLDVEHISDVPPGTENTDTKTVATLGYDF